MNCSRLPGILFFLALCALLITAYGSPQSTKKIQAAQKDVHVSGCPVAGVELGCLMLSGSDGQMYDITAAPAKSDSPGSKPAKPKIGDFAITVDGNRSRDLSVCQQGIRLKDIDWAYTKQRCSGRR